MESILIGLAVFVGLIVVMLPLILLRAFVLVKLWSWFLVPLGIFEINYAYAIGISLIVSYLTHQTEANKDENLDTKKYWLSAIFQPLITLLIGWITVQFI